MPDPLNPAKGDRSMTQGFVAQYAVEAALGTPGVYDLDTTPLVSLKETLVGEHEGKGVLVYFNDAKENLVNITVFPILYYGNVLPEIAWNIQERVKNDVEKYTGLMVESVNVHVKGVVAREDPAKQK
ncbi:MAG: Asp23/Gls24 family envelope stress response protein [Eubacteriales bacterium]|nr:Asp23/Gls24 family envelope stress response protein [Eubacteriales bacterium]MDD4326880.1 Asp23/Gls24 family envelope stress response protein [Eubacteriales bacterium]MDD4717553.1 Asp23/Gls24 family envelope stress response protein [Eubacteriales bacterium]NCU26049.1 Asp23/Gls24 family envelope stress response protein [Candidatus Nomurabacteria bacterium]